MIDTIEIKHPTINNGEWVKLHTNNITESGSKNLDAKPDANNGVEQTWQEVNDMSYENIKFSLPITFLNTRSGYLTREMLLVLYKTRYTGDNPILLRGTHQGIPITDLDGNDEVEVVLKSYSINWVSSYKVIDEDTKSGVQCSLVFMTTKNRDPESEE